MERRCNYPSGACASNISLISERNAPRNQSAKTGYFTYPTLRPGPEIPVLFDLRSKPASSFDPHRFDSLSSPQLTTRRETGLLFEEPGARRWNNVDRHPGPGLRFRAGRQGVAGNRCPQTADQHVYVKGSLGVSSSRLNALEKWMDQNAPNWTVVLMVNARQESFSEAGGRTHHGMDAVEFALGQTLPNKTAFGELKHAQTGEANGAYFLVFLHGLAGINELEPQLEAVRARLEVAHEDWATLDQIAADASRFAARTRRSSGFSSSSFSSGSGTSSSGW